MTDSSAPVDPDHESTPQTEAAPAREPRGKDPLRTSRTSSMWFGIVGFGVVLVLLAIFILQNTQSIRLSFLGWRWHIPLAVALLAATAGGILATAIAGTLRILQLRRRVRRERRREKSAR